MGDPDGVLPAKWFSGNDNEALDDFMGQGFDVLVIATPLTEETRGIMTSRRFEILGKNRKAFLVNIGRGQIVETDALMKALDSGIIGGAALDVTDPEPLPRDHPLWKKKNVFITPHISGNSNRYKERVLRLTRSNFQRMSEGKEFVNLVDRKLKY